MSIWYDIENQEDVDLSDDGKEVHVLYNTNDQGSMYVLIPIVFVKHAIASQPAV